MTIHATAIVLGPLGFLITGRSGSGKSSLALAAMEACRAQGGFAALVADDRCLLEVVNHKALATCPPVLAGLVEMRGFGIVDTGFITSAVIDIVIELQNLETIERLPQAHSTTLAGVTFPLFALPQRQILTSVPILMHILRQRRF